MATPPIIFISYSHKDEIWKDRVLTHLGVLKRLGQVDLWDDRRIRLGDNWLGSINEALNAASVALLLISKAFLNSPFIMEKEVPRLFERSASEGVRIIPLILEPCAWLVVPWLAQNQAHPKDGRPLSEGDDNQIDRDLAVLTTEIQQLLASVSPPPKLGPFVSLPPARVAPSRLPSTGAYLFGRDKELRILDQAWDNRNQHIISLVAFGGVGKTALIKHWLGLMSTENYRGAELVFDWSFYSQGTSNKAAAADEFIDRALRFFGDTDPTAGSPWDKGHRLAHLVASSRTLLVLDGLEPLQYPLGPLEGQIRDPALATFITGLAARNSGLCVITTRVAVSEVLHLQHLTAPRIPLEHLSTEAGAKLLAELGVKGTNEELEEASAAFAGHALALTLLGTSLTEFRRGQVSGWREIPLLKDDQRQGRHARRVMQSYEKWMLGRQKWSRRLRKALWLLRPRNHPSDSGSGEAAWSLLRLMGYFDRPAKESEIRTLLNRPPIKGLTGAIVNLDSDAFQRTLSDLRRLRLITEESEPGSIDAHPLVREFLSEDLQKRFAKAWIEGNYRLYQHLRGSNGVLPKTPEDMAPYYQAIAHACFAGRHKEAFEEVYMPYIRQGTAYNTDSLRGFGNDYSALCAFLQNARFEVVPKLKAHSSFILGEIGFDLRALGRLDEALEAMEAAMKADEANCDFVNASAQAAILSHTHLVRGRISQAITSAHRGAELADKNMYFSMVNIANRADGRHYAGELDLALKDFAESERLSIELFGSLLRSLLGCRYCDCLLSKGEYAEVLRRTEKTLKWDREGGYKLSQVAPQECHNLRHALQVQGTVLPLALNRLTRCRALLQEFEQTAAQASLKSARTLLEEALNWLRKAETRHELPRGLLVEVELLRLEENFDDAHQRLQEVLAVAQMGKMELYEADAQLQFAWLALSEKKPTDALESLRKTRSMINKLGYHRLTPPANEIKKRLMECELS